MEPDSTAEPGPFPQHKEVDWSNDIETGQPVIWGEQISNTIRELQSLMFFPVPKTTENLQPAGDSTQGKGLDQKNKRRGKGPGKEPRKPRVVKNKRSTSPPMGLDEVAGTDPDPVFGLNDVANYECIGTDGDQLNVKDNPELGYNSPKFDDIEKRRRRRSNVNGEKPNNTYTEIITAALEAHPEGLTVSEIYDFISRRYSYYQPNDDRWKNSVRHNLSISPYFRKGGKSKQGAGHGHVWILSEDCQDLRLYRRRPGTGLIPRVDYHDDSGPTDGSKSNPEPIDLGKLKTETDIAVASILANFSRASSKDKPADSPPPKLELAVPHEMELENNNFLKGNDLPLSTLDCSELDLQFGSMETFVSSTAQTQEVTINGYDGVNELDEGELVDIEEAGPAGLILNLNSYFQPDELQMLLDQSLEDSENPRQ